MTNSIINSKNGMTTLTFLFTLILWFTTITPAMADKSASFTLKFEVPLITVLSINDEVLSPTIKPGTNMMAATTTYDIMTNGINMKIVAQLGSNMPDGTIFTIQVDAPKGWISIGKKELDSMTSTIVATGLRGVSEKDISITYEFSATTTADMIPIVYLSLIE